MDQPSESGSEDAEWIGAAGYEGFKHSGSTTHTLLPVPGAVLSYGSTAGPDTVYGLVP